MKKMYFVFTVLVLLVFQFVQTDMYGQDEITGVMDAKLQKFCTYLDDNNPPKGDDIKQGFKELVDAMVLALPQAGFSPEFNNSIREADNMFKQNSIFDSQALQLLLEAYRSINNGKNFEIPGGLKEISDAKEYCNKCIVLSRANLKEGKLSEAVKNMLELAIMVVTPIKKVKHQ